MATPYTEFTEANASLEEIKKTVPTGGKIYFLTDNTVPTDIKTYIFLQRNAAIPNIPNPPSGWIAYEVEYDQETELKFDVDNNTVYVITEDQAVYMKIN